MAEILWGMQFGPETTWSAGTHAVIGQSIHPLAAAALRNLGVRLPSEFRDGTQAAQQVTPMDLKRADLILTMTTEHRSAVAAMAAAASPRCFTVTEFAQLLESAAHAPDAAGRLDLRALHRARRSESGRASGNLDIPDPIGGDTALFRSVGEQLANSIQVIADHVRT